MSLTASESPATIVVSGARALFSLLAVEHAAKIAAEAREVAVIHQLCLAHGTVDEEAFNEAGENVVHFGLHGTPAVAEFLSLEVAALLGMSDSSAAYLIARVLNCVYRHPLLWEAVQSGMVAWRQALDVVDDVTSAGLSLEAALWVDQRITPLLMTLPRHRMRRRLHGLVALADPALAREREHKARVHRHVTFHQPSVGRPPAPTSPPRCTSPTPSLSTRSSRSRISRRPRERTSKRCYRTARLPKSSLETGTTKH